MNGRTMFIAALKINTAQLQISLRWIIQKEIRGLSNKTATATRTCTHMWHNKEGK